LISRPCVLDRTRSADAVPGPGRAGRGVLTATTQSDGVDDETSSVCVRQRSKNGVQSCQRLRGRRTTNILARGTFCRSRRCSDGEPACRRGSVRPEGRGGHPSKRPTWGLPPVRRRTGRPCPTFGLAPGGVYLAARVTPGAGALLPHRFTIACADRSPPSAVCSLLHCPSGRPDWLLASTLPNGAPTFLDTVPAEAGPCRGHPADSPSPSSVPGRATIVGRSSPHGHRPPAR
jgi:hypothetical protein